MKQKTILYIAVTIDGFIAREDESIDFLKPFEGTKEDYGYNNFLKSIDTIVIGNNTYKQILSFGKFPYKNKKCYVFTKNKSKKSDENVTFVNSTKQFLEKTKSSENIWLVGGSQLIQEFLKHNLIDEFILSYVPIILGGGIPLFTNNKQKQLTLIKIKKYKSGIVQLHYTIS